MKNNISTEQKSIKNFFSLENLMALMPECVYWKDKEGRYQGCNDFLLMSAGFKSKNEILGKDDYFIGEKLGWNKEIIDEIVRVDQQILKTGIPIFNIEEPPFKVITDKMIWQRSSKVPIKNENNEIIGLIGISFDFTRQKETEQILAEQARKSELMNIINTEFLSLASHEIRGPISNVISILNILSDFLFSSPASEKNENETIIGLVNSAINESNECLRSMDYLSKFISLNRTGVESNSNDCVIEDFIKIIISKYPINIYEKNKKVIIDTIIKDNVPKSAAFDYYHLDELLDILISNAIRFCKETAKISILVERNEKYLMFTVMDNGVGIPPDQLEHLLTPILIENNHPKLMEYRKPSIKLSYVNKMIRLLGGSLSINSEIGVGTEVCISIPFFEKELMIANTENTVGINQKKLQILLVDDNRLTLRLEESILEKMGHSVESVENGLEAVEKGLKEDFDVVFLDITLPDISGIEVLHRIQKLSGDGMYFVAVTSHSSEEDMAKFHEEGFMSVLIKPVLEKDFRQCIDTIIKMKNDKLND